jgi:hypothetical protein
VFKSSLRKNAKSLDFIGTSELLNFKNGRKNGRKLCDFRQNHHIIHKMQKLSEK